MGNKFQIVWRLLVVVFLALLPVSPVLASPVFGVTIKMQFSTGITSFTVTYVGNNEAVFNWTLDPALAVNIMIRGEYNRYPSNIPNENTAPSDGYLVYYGDGIGVTTATDYSLNQDDNVATLYYKAWAQRADGTWYIATSTSSQESRVMLFIAFVVVALVLTGFCFVWHNILLALAGMIGWLVLAGYIIFGGNTAIDTTTTWGLLLIFLFVILCFVPLIRFISMLGKTKVSHTDKTGRMWSLWEKPPKPKFVSSAEQTREKRRQEIRAAIERAQTRRS